MNKKLLGTLAATTTLTSTLISLFPQAATAGVNYLGTCKQPETGNAIVYYSHDGVVSSITGIKKSDGKIRKDRVRNHLQQYRGLTYSEATDIRSGLPSGLISNLTECSMSQFPFSRGASNPTAFHSVSSGGQTGADVFQQFSNTESSALDLATLNARKLDISKLELTYDNDVKIYFINEGAGHRNQLQLSTTGTDVKSGMVFNNVSCHSSDSDCAGPWSSPSNSDYALKAGDYVDIGTLRAGTKLDFQVIANGFANSNAHVWNTDTSLNSDGLQHVIAYDYEGYLVLGWEDLNGGGDLDYNDVVFAVYIGEDNLNNIPTDPVYNTAPIAADDVATTPYQTAVTVDVLAGDTDADGDALSLDSIATNPSNGSVAISSNNVIYTPSNGFSGVDSFDYVVSDGQGGTATATVTVTVEPSVTIPAPSCPVGSTITLTGTVRDFSDSHPNFQSSGTPGFRFGLDTGITTDQIGSDRKPVYAGGSFSTTTDTAFDQWYRDVPGINVGQDYSIDLVLNSSGLYRFQDTSFFPIDNQLMGNEGRSHNYHFTYEIHSQFTYKGGEVLNFSGDDDVWVYINGYKIIDIGGVHSRLDRNVNIDDIAAAAGLTIGNTYDFDFFFAERHTTASNFILETSIDLLCDTDGDGISDLVEGGGDADGDGIANYEDEDSDGNGILDSEEGAGDSDGDGILDFLDADNDGNGIDDINDSTDDIDGDGILDYQDSDDDGDGTDDINDNDIDGNGVDNSAENNPTLPADFPLPANGSPDDIDGDGILNSVDADNDGDGVSDTDEDKSHYDLDLDGIDDISISTSGSDTVITYTLSSGNPTLPNGATLPNGGTTYTRIISSNATDDDINGDGVPNYLDPNDDGDDFNAQYESNYNSGHPAMTPRHGHVPDLFSD